MTRAILVTGYEKVFISVPVYLKPKQVNTDSFWASDHHPIKIFKKCSAPKRKRPVLLSKLCLNCYARLVVRVNHPPPPPQGRVGDATGVGMELVPRGAGTFVGLGDSKLQISKPPHNLHLLCGRLLPNHGSGGALCGFWNPKFEVPTYAWGGNGGALHWLLHYHSPFKVPFWHLNGKDGTGKLAKLGTSILWKLAFWLATFCCMAEDSPGGTTKLGIIFVRHEMHKSLF